MHVTKFVQKFEYVMEQKKYLVYKLITINYSFFLNNSLSSNYLLKVSKCSA